MDECITSTVYRIKQWNAYMGGHIKEKVRNFQNMTKYTMHHIYFESDIYSGVLVLVEWPNVNRSMI